MRKLKKCLQTYTVPSVEPAKIEALVDLCSTYLPNKIEERFETSMIKQIGMVVFAGKKSWLVFEILISVLFMFGVHLFMDSNTLFFVTFTSSFMAFLLLIHFFENVSSGTWELEKTCMISTERVLLYKITTIGVLHMFLLLGLSLYTSFMTPYDFLTILCYGCFPFFLNLAFLFHFSIHFKNKGTFLGSFIGTNMISFLFVEQFTKEPSMLLLLGVTIASILYFLYSIHKYLIKMEEEGGCLLWN